MKYYTYTKPNFKCVIETNDNNTKTVWYGSGGYVSDIQNEKLTISKKLMKHATKSAAFEHAGIPIEPSPFDLATPKKKKKSKSYLVIIMDLPKLPDGWVYQTRETGLIEACCPCGVGHPLPKAFQPKKHQNSYSGVHGCCGCCSIFKSVFVEKAKP